jgi:type II secretory pathway component PulF
MTRETGRHGSHASAIERLAKTTGELLARGAPLAHALEAAAAAIADSPSLRQAARTMASRIAEGAHPSVAAQEVGSVVTQPFVELLILGQASSEAFAEIERVFRDLAELGGREDRPTAPTAAAPDSGERLLTLLVLLRSLLALGCPLTHAMRVAATDTPPDVADWITSIADELDAGRALEAALDRAGAAPESVRELLTGGCRRGTLIDDLDDWITRRLSRRR